MRRPRHKPPTALELEILKVLWKRHPATVQEVRDGVAPSRDLAYTTVMTMLGVMHRKRLVTRTKQGQKYLYRPIRAAETTSRSMVRDLVDRVFDGSVTALMHSLLGDASIDEKQLAEISELVERKMRGCPPTST